MIILKIWGPAKICFIEHNNYIAGLGECPAAEVSALGCVALYNRVLHSQKTYGKWFAWKSGKILSK